MKTILAIAVLAALAFLGFKMLKSGGIPQGSLDRVVEAPGVAVSRLNLSGGSLPTILLVAGGGILAIFVIYLLMRK